MNIMLFMTHVQYGTRESLRERAWIVGEAARMLRELGTRLREEDRSELLKIIQSQAQLLQDSLDGKTSSDRYGSTSAPLTG